MPFGRHSGYPYPHGVLQSASIVITDTAQIQRITERFPFLQHGDSAFKRRFFHSVKLAHLDQGVSICHEGMQCSALSLVLAGSARVFKLSESGREITLYRIGPGGSCILTASCIVNAQPFPALAVSETQLEAVVIPTGDVLRWLDDSAAWRGYLFGLISERLSDVITIVEEVAFKRVDRRISSFLLSRADTLSSPSMQGQLIKATHQEIASDLGTSREVVSRILKELESQGCIAVSRGSIRLLDVESLRAKAAEA